MATKQRSESSSGPGPESQEKFLSHQIQSAERPPRVDMDT